MHICREIIKYTITYFWYQLIRIISNKMVYFSMFQFFKKSKKSESFELWPYFSTQSWIPVRTKYHDEWKILIIYLFFVIFMEIIFEMFFRNTGKWKNNKPENYFQYMISQIIYTLFMIWNNVHLVIQLLKKNYKAYTIQSSRFFKYW